MCFDKAYCGYNTWKIYFETKTDFTVKVTDEGMIFSGTDGVKAAIDLDDRSETSPHVFLVAADSVLVSYNEENSTITLSYQMKPENAVTKIKIIEYTDTSITLDFNGEIRLFTIDE